MTERTPEEHNFRAKVWRIVLLGLAGFWAAVLVFLGSCSPASNRGADGYDFRGPEWTSLTFQVEMVPYSSPVEFRRAAIRLGALAEDGGETRAFAQVQKGGLCRIHVLDLKVKYEPEWIGHELTHCMHGRWHRPGQSGEAR